MNRWERKGGRSEADRLLERFVETRDPALRDELVECHRRLAYSVANRFRGKGEEDADLHQVALLGLVKAIERYRPISGISFTTFAVPTIQGEIKRHLRDNSWSVHVPRGTKELLLRARRTAAEWASRTGQDPTPRELAATLGTTEENIRQALSAQEALRPLPLTMVRCKSETELQLEDFWGEDDPDMQRSEARTGVRQALRKLHTRLREIVRLRYLKDLSQREVGRQLGMSQMQVSRLERQALSELRRELAPSSI